MASGSFATGGVSVAPLAINQPAIYSGNFTWSSPIADLAANAAAAQAANHQATHISAPPQPQPKPVDPTRNTPQHAATQYANGQQIIVPGYTDPKTGYPEGKGAADAPSAGAAVAGATKTTTDQGNIPAGATVKNIGGVNVSLSDWAIQHLIDHHNDTPGSGATDKTGGPGAQP